MPAVAGVSHGACAPPVKQGEIMQGVPLRALKTALATCGLVVLGATAAQATSEPSGGLVDDLVDNVTAVVPVDVPVTVGCNDVKDRKSVV